MNEKRLKIQQAIKLIIERAKERISELKDEYYFESETKDMEELIEILKYNSL